MLRRSLIVLLVAAFLTLAGAYAIFWAPNSFDGDRFITVSKGETFRQVLDSLDNAGVIHSRLLVDLAGRLSDYTTRMQVGKYRFKSGMSNLELLRDIRYGITTELILVTIPEGLRPSRQAHILAKHLGIDSARFVKLITDSALTRDLGIGSSSLIGYLMPATYKLYWQCDEEEIVRDMLREFWHVYDTSLLRETRERGMTVDEILTMASIIEMETSIDSERAVIAGVYYNRLHKGMRLQADPTVQFIITDGPRALSRSDLAMESPYNTYRHEGLPPGPISSPGRASILAALNPLSHKYLFFVATGFGGHTFSKTFQQHLRAIRNYHRVREEQQAAKDTG